MVTSEIKIKRNIRIATVYSKKTIYKLYTMDTVRWFKISEALANKGYTLDIIINNGRKIKQLKPNLRYVPYDKVRWADYHVIKTIFHEGFESLVEAGGDSHSFIISKLGSVVSKEENGGIHFHGKVRQKLYSIQKQINYRSKYISVLTDESKNLWKREFSKSNNILLVPTGVDRKIPPPQRNPYKNFKEKIAVYIGNIYSKKHQRDVNLRWQYRLNQIGEFLKKRKIRLCLIGNSETDKLNNDYVTYMGPIENKNIWDYQYFADVGIVLAQGREQHNESSKIYYYLRTGLPVVSESLIPNNNLIREAGLGFISDYGNDRMIADFIEEAIYKKWDKKKAINYILENHTWDKRAEIYDKILKDEFLYRGKMK